MLFGSIVNRLATSVKRALSQYAVGANEPELALNFIDNEYITNNSASTFASAVTHSMSSNSVMTDGYGPELLTNGNFSTGDITGWTTNGSPTVSRGVVTLPITGSNTRYIQQNLSTVSGVTYVINLNLVDADSNSRNIRVSVDSSAGTFTGNLLAENASINANGNSIEFVFTATSSTSYFRIFTNTTTNGHYTSLDNISVREMPVLKWAPHNFQQYSDDVSQGSGSTGVTRTATTLTETTSTGEHRIQCGINSPVVGQKFTMALEAKSGVGSRNICFRGYGEGGATKYPVFDIVNGTVRQNGTSFTDVSITDVGDGYYLCKASVVTSSVFRWAVHMADETATLGTNAVHSYTGDGSSSVLLRKLRQYNSNLGGMTNNPDNSGNDADFVATSGSAKYLPRIGHHVYNGSAWVNEGLLAESEQRINEFLYSNDFTDAYWGKQNTPSGGLNFDGIGPDGQTNSAVKLIDDNGGGSGGVRLHRTVTVTASTDYTFSIYAKADQLDDIFIYIADWTSAGGYYFDLTNGTFTEQNAGSATTYTATMQDVGNGWYRCALAWTTDTDTTIQPRIFVADGTSFSVARDGTSSILIYGAQFEEGSTPSSFCPTIGQERTRAAETFTVPSANLPWPNPVYTYGSDLVVNGGFDTDTDWDKSGGWTISGGTANNSGYGPTNNMHSSLPIGAVAGNQYEVTFTVSNYSGGTVRVFVGSTDTTGFARSANGTYTEIHTAAGLMYLYVQAFGFTGSVDNISVREATGSQAVSFAIDGRVNYTDQGTFTDDLPFYWYTDSNNRIDLRFDGNSTNVGRPLVVHRIGGDQDLSAAPNIDFFEDGESFQPFNIAGRITSTKVQGAFDGVTGTENTITDGLVDLSSTDLRIAFNYMGSLGTVRIWDKDITEDGIIEATNPSLEPSLSLTFEGTSTNSFVVNDWSE